MNPAARPRHSAVPRRRHPFATVVRILAQLRGDPRTIGLILVVPALLLTLLYFVFSEMPVPPHGTAPFDRIGPIMLAVLPMLLMFIVTSVVMLRERTSGTLERVLTTPLSRGNLIASYAAVFGALAGLQALLLGGLVLVPFHVEIAGPPVLLLLTAVLDGLFGVAFGLLASAFARTEFQAVQFMPAFIGPQIFLCGLLAPTDQMPDALAAVAGWLPMTWAVDAVNDVVAHADPSGETWWRLGGLAAVVLAALGAAAASMRRTTR